MIPLTKGQSRGKFSIWWRHHDTELLSWTSLSQMSLIVAGDFHFHSSAPEGSSICIVYKSSNLWIISFCSNKFTEKRCTWYTFRQKSKVVCFRNRDYWNNPKFRAMLTYYMKRKFVWAMPFCGLDFRLCIRWFIRRIFVKWLIRFILSKNNTCVTSSLYSHRE